MVSGIIGGQEDSEDSRCDVVHRRESLLPVLYLSPSLRPTHGAAIKALTSVIALLVMLGPSE